MAMGMTRSRLVLARTVVLFSTHDACPHPDNRKRHGHAPVRLRGSAAADRDRAREAVRQLSTQRAGGEPVMQHSRSRTQRAGKLLKLSMLRAGFALGGHFVPRRTVERAARLFATPYGSSRSR